MSNDSSSSVFAHCRLIGRDRALIQEWVAILTNRS